MIMDRNRSNPKDNHRHKNQASAFQELKSSRDDGNKRKAAEARHPNDQSTAKPALLNGKRAEGPPVKIAHTKDDEENEEAIRD